MLAALTHAVDHLHFEGHTDDWCKGKAVLSQLSLFLPFYYSLSNITALTIITDITQSKNCLYGFYFILFYQFT